MMWSSFGFLACLLLGGVLSHPLCFVDDRPTDFDQDLTFCPAAQDGACCTDIEEQRVADIVDAAGNLSPECFELYKEVVCGVCHSYSAHLYERLGAELGAMDGMTMKQAFCDDLVDACADEIPAIAATYENGISYCAKHVGPTGDQFWSYPYVEAPIFEPGLAEVFPDLDSDDFPDSVISLRQTPDGSEFWLVGQKGKIQKIDANDLDNIDDIVDISDNDVFYEDFEEGLLDMAFDPMFGVAGTPNYFYLSYTCQLDDGENQRNRISKFEYFAGDTSKTFTSEEVLITTAPKFNSIHSAGWCGFKPSDYGDGQAFHDLYWTTGDGGPQTDDLNTGQDTSNMMGSMMRISVPSDGTGYNIPSGNFGSGPDVLEEICASGFRNPFRCSFDRKTDVLYCGDVGHTDVEEIDIVECGKNYGWSRFEGSRCQEAQEDRDGDCEGASRSGFTFPEFEYCHPDYFSTGSENEFTGNQDICGDRFITGHAVIGGYVYRGTYFSEVLTGAYIFGDATNRNIYYMTEVEGKQAIGTIVSDGSVQIISFSEDNNGEIMMITRSGNIYHMPCGDLCASTCLEQSEDIVEVKDLGCYADDPNDRALTLASSDCPVDERAMSAQVCGSYCDTLGAKYAGLQFSYECFCGNNDDFGKHGELSTASCQILCTANPTEFCGGNLAIQIFEVSSTLHSPVTPSPIADGGAPPTPTIEPTPSPSGGMPVTPSPTSDGGALPTPSPIGDGGSGDLIGCFEDTKNDRIMTMSASQTPMSSQICQSLCTDSLFYGTQFSNECWCGGLRTDFDVHGTATCNLPCAGNMDEICGGFNAMSVYANEPTQTDDGDEGTQTDDDESTDDDTSTSSFLGCFNDMKNSRIMSGPNVESPMSAEICLAICDSTYYGTQFGNECWCGDDDTDFDAHGTSTGCTVDCAGNSDESCGGNNAMSVYSSGSGDSPAPDPIPDGPGPAFIGCFADTMSDRIMTDKVSSSSMSSEACAALCDESPFFGTQFGLECWCGENSDFDRHGTAVCDFDCTGDSSEKCGGREAMSVYSS